MTYATIVVEVLGCGIVRRVVVSSTRVVQRTEQDLLESEVFPYVIICAVAVVLPLRAAA
jgi:hypothetical protein